MVNSTSATGGPLQPDPTPAPLEGAALQKFLQNWLVPLCGLPSTLVRPRWQDEPPIIPEANTAWMAFGVLDRTADTFPYVGHSGAGDGTSTLRRNEEMRVLCSFYDTGVTGEADMYASLLRDNLAIQQNLEPLYAANFALGYVEKLTPAPVMLGTRWLYRMDLPVIVRRQIDRTYEVQNVKSASGTIYTDVPNDQGENYEFPVTVEQD